MEKSFSRPQSFFIVIIIYVLAFFLAWFIIFHFHDENIFLRILYADLAATILVFIASTIFKNASIYDPYWSVIPIWIAIYLTVMVSFDLNLRGMLAVIVVVMWGIRLTWNWTSQWRGMHHEDWRYMGFRKKTGSAFWLVNFSGIHLMPTLLVFLGCLALVPAIGTNSTPVFWLDYLAFGLCVIGVIIESTADRQLRKFQHSNPPPDAILNSGLWKHVRHPNYTGEIIFWWGIFLFGLAASPKNWWMMIGPVAITLLFIFISIPLIDRRMQDRRPGYPSHMRTTPPLLPGIKW